MTTAEALAIAAQAKPEHRQPRDKLQRGDAAGDVSARAEALRKRYDAIGNDLSDLTKQLDQLRADLDHIETNPGAKRRIIH
jgi:hypothetical protein